MKKQNFFYVFVVCLFTFSVNVFYCNLGGLEREYSPDGVFYVGIAKGLESGVGYTYSNGLWKTSATMERMPVWPIMIFLFGKLLPLLDLNAVARLVGALCNSVTAATLTTISMILFKSRLSGLITGLIYCLFPSAIFLMDNALSEIPFVMFLSLGMLSCLKQEKLYTLEAFLFGMAAATRANFIIFPIIFLSFIGFGKIIRRKYINIDLRKSIIYVTFFFIPILPWLIRNYFLSGHFPIISTTKGETLYGAYNDVVSEDLSKWGYWVMPDLIPGQEKKENLVMYYDEVGLNNYYQEQSITWIKQNYQKLPRLMLGRLVRAYMPIPWSSGIEVFYAFFYRFILIVGFIMSFLFVNRLKTRYNFLLLVFVAINLITTLIFYGNARFSFTLEVFYIPYAGCFLTFLLDRAIAKLKN